MWDPLVTDVHTDGPDQIFTGDPGAVLYNATGNAALMRVAVDMSTANAACTADPHSPIMNLPAPTVRPA